MKLASIRPLLIASALLGTQLGTVLHAQVDPRLAKVKTDVLDVYYGSQAQGPKPEIISVIDNSASMAGLYWSRYYWANNNESWHNNNWPSYNGDNRLVPIVYKSGSGSSVSITVSIHQAVGSGGASLVVNQQALVTGGLLVEPNGNPVTYADAGNSDDPKDWIQRASHVRFALTSNSTATTYTWNSTSYSVPNLNVRPRPLTTSGSTADYTSASQGNVLGTGNVRVVDIPIPWGAFDAVPYYEGQNTSGVGPNGSTVPGTYARPLSPSPVWPSGDYSTAQTKKHPQHAYVYDGGLNPPTSYAAWYEVDAVWSQGAKMYDSGGSTSNQDGILQTVANLSWYSWNNGGYWNWGTQPTNAYGKIGAFNYTSDYLWWCFFGQDTRNQVGGVHPQGAYNNGYVDQYSGSNAGGYTVPDVRENGAGFVLHNGVAGNGLPCLTKFMAIKKALFTVYVANEANVEWCVRFLNNDPSISSGYSSNSQSGNPGDRQLLILAPPNSSNQPDQNSVRYIITMQALTNTPLNAAMMNAYAQMADTTHTLFNTSAPNCTKSFVIVLSDGSPTDTGAYPSDPYQTGAVDGNNAIASDVSSLKGGKYYNIATIAGVAAQSPAITNNWDIYGGNPGNVPLPWPITTRGASKTSPRYTSTLTIGVGLSGTLLDSTGSQRAMYSAALYGWQGRRTWDIKPGDIGYKTPDPYLSTPTATDKNVNPFFFDANDPDNLAGALDTAVSLTRLVTNTMGAPVAPLVGLSLGKQIYLGIFNTPDSPVWSGDLLMSGLSISGGTITVLDNKGVATVQLKAGTAVWSAADMLGKKGWKNRNMFTLKPNASNLPTGPSQPGAFTNNKVSWNEGMNTTDMPNSVLGVGTSQDRQSLIRFMMGADKSAQIETTQYASGTASRDDIMGDIINSTPAIIPFPMGSIPSSSSLSSYDSSGLTNPQFRLILVGDNQGILHCFGEVSGFDKTTGLLQGKVDELWAFIIPDNLYGLQAWRNGSKHLYLMDGSPIVYLNEQGTANGLVDGDDILRVAFGLGKAGRSVYCLKFDKNSKGNPDPSSPQIDWMIRPDEKTTATSGTDLMVKTMGFSTSKPTPARIKDGSILKDVFLIGGGLSTSDVDTAFSAATTATPPGLGSTVKLGHSIMAVNVASSATDGTPDILSTYWDFYNNSTLKAAYPNMGCIPATVVPVEVLQPSYQTQRVYFSDTSGSVSVLGAVASSGQRVDTPDIQSWGVRKLYTPGYAGTPVSTSPAVFTMPFGYPVVRTSAPTAIVPSMGVVFMTGDRNDPMDNDAINPNNNNTPNRNRLVMVIDRQDSADVTGALGKVDTYGFTDHTSSGGSDLQDLTTASTSPGYSYLQTKFGYQLQFTAGTTKPSAAGTGDFYQKGVTSPLVLNQALFFSHYTPNSTSSVCGGSGTTYTYRLCDVLAPVYNSGTVQAAASTSGCTNGWYVSYNDIPSELANVGLRGVLQAGEVQGANGQGQGIIQTTGIPGNALSNLVRPRAWRIVR